jgi:SLS1 protein N-terminal domain
MITRPASRSHICLSCRRSLANRKPPALYQIARQTTSSSPKEASTAPLQEEPLDNGNVVRKSFNSSQISHQPFGRLHGRHGVKLRENLEKLQATSLGEEANVIVLRDSGFTAYEQREQLKAKEAEHIDILGQLADERGLVGQDEVNRNIDAFRPKKGSEPEDWDDINTLVRDLQEGFTITQLENYIETFEGRGEPESPPEEWVNDEETAPISAITPWQPGISNDTDHFDNDPLRGYFLESHTSKQRVILQLLRECWMLELPELEEGMGQFEIKINQDDLVVLLSKIAECISLGRRTDTIQWELSLH